ncbi:DNA-3-methyladenine glycosylase [Streptosporangium sp. NPDC048865]|uniref:DNA-3-methyladenine glycosylase n=1 Tax=Streptosporangium sp. NPDC048865 TaxID=3155766 RepID=UPI0034435805
MTADEHGGRTPAASAPLARDFFDRPAHEVAPDLLGRVLVHGPVALRLTEVEAYGVPGEDPASHTYRGRTPRNAVMFGPPGHLYVYFTYGMHFCANLTCLPEGVGSGVLLRAGEVVSGVETALARRSAGGARPVKEVDLAKGPARLAVALGFGREHNGLDACGPGSLSVTEGEPAKASSILSGPRTGVSSGKETPWRFWIEGERTVSPHRPHVPRRR